MLEASRRAIANNKLTLILFSKENKHEYIVLLYVHINMIALTTELTEEEREREKEMFNEHHLNMHPDTNQHHFKENKREGFFDIYQQSNAIMGYSV